MRAAKVPFGERAAQPAGAQAEAGGVEDGLLDEVAVVLEVLGRASHGAHQKARRPLDEAVGAKAPERLAVAGAAATRAKRAREPNGPTVCVLRCSVSRIRASAAIGSSRYVRHEYRALISSVTGRSIVAGIVTG